MNPVDQLDYEDTLLNGFESHDLRRENASLKKRLEVATAALADLNTSNAKPGISALRAQAARADRFERLYQITLQRCEILNRKIKELGG